MELIDKQTVDINHRQLCVNKLGGFVELRFGVYLDTIMGYHYNLKEFQSMQLEASSKSGYSVEKLDKLPLTRGKGPTSTDLEECRRLEIHRMIQGDFKKNNSPGGSNYDFAIENCLSDIFNFWKKVKELLGLESAKDFDIFPIMDYLRKLRNRLQHDLYNERVSSEKEPIKLNPVTSYSFPSFEMGQRIQLSEKDIEAIVFEVRAQLSAYLIPYLNNSVPHSVRPELVEGSGDMDKKLT